MLSCTIQGTGNPILLLHGIPGSQATWMDVATVLQRTARVVMPDLLGFGGSPDGSAVPHAFEQASAVLATLDAHRVASADIAGFDFGGPVAVALYSLAPHRVRSLTLIATNLLTDTPVPLPLRIARARPWGELAFRAMFSDAGGAVLWRMATVNRDAFPLRAFRESMDPRGAATTRRIFLASLRELNELYAPIEHALPEIAVPVTFVWGDSDPFFPIRTAERTASRIPAARLIILEHCGHFVPNEKAADVATAILDLQTKYRAPTAPQFRTRA
jgi:pimeloyl-ACP methyl ester carboxylesterase